MVMGDKKLCEHCGGIGIHDPYCQNVRTVDDVAQAVAAERTRCANICRGLVTAYKMGAGSEYTAGERIIGIATAEWLANEIEGRKS
jgi:hypothetical protein